MTWCVVSRETPRHPLLSREQWGAEVAILSSVPRSPGQLPCHELGRKAVKRDLNTTAAGSSWRDTVRLFYVQTHVPLQLSFISALFLRGVL